jgi:hypothetical protein
MAGPAPKTQKWTARENQQGEQLALVVGGQVEVTSTYKTPKLAQGGPLRDPHTLNLELTIVDSGQSGAEVVVWMPASFQTTVTPDQYHDVVVRWDGEKIAQFAVIDDREHATLMDKQSKVQNTVAKVARAPKKPAAKKAAKKAAAKKVAGKTATKKKPRAVGGWAKGKKKKSVAKSSKKAAKKTAKKGAQKSTLKRLVKKLVRKLSPAKKKSGKKKR